GASLQNLQDFRDHPKEADLRGRRGPEDPMLFDRAVKTALAAAAKGGPAPKGGETPEQVEKALREQVCQPSSPFDLNFLKAVPDAEVAKLTKALAAVREAGDDAALAGAPREAFERAYQPLFDKAFRQALEAQELWVAARFQQPFEATSPVGPQRVYSVG